MVFEKICSKRDLIIGGIPYKTYRSYKTYTTHMPGKLFFTIVLVTAVVAFILGRGSASLFPEKVTAPFAKLSEAKLPNVDLNPQTTSTIELAGSSASARLKVLSVNLIGSYEEFAPTVAPKPTDATTSATPEPSEKILRLKELRILGQVENIGSQVAVDATPIIRFYSKTRVLLGTKRGLWTSGYAFYPLERGKKRYFDITSSDIPSEVDRLEFLMEPQSREQAMSAIPEGLKIKGKKLETKKAKADNQTITTYALSGTITNTGRTSIADIAVQTFLLDTTGKVFGASYRSFPQDILVSNQDLPFFQPVIPVRTSDFGDYHVEVFGKELK